MKRMKKRLLLITIILTFVLALSAGVNLAGADTVSDSTLFGTWKLGYVLGNGAEGLNRTIDNGTSIYYFFTDDRLSGLSVAPDGSKDRLAGRAYTVSNGKLHDASGADMTVYIQDGVLHMSQSGTEMLLVRADLDFLKGGTWYYIGLRDDGQPDTVQKTQEFLSAGGTITFTFRDTEATVATTWNGSTSAKQVPYTVLYDNVIKMYGDTVEVLIAENQMVITDGTTWQYYEKK